MPDSDNAQWVLEVMTILRSPDADLVRDLLEHLARLRAAQEVEAAKPFFSPPGLPVASLPSGTTPDKRWEIELQLRRDALHARLREGWQKVVGLPPCLRQARYLKETAFFAMRSALLTDPLVSGDHLPLTLGRAKEYAHRARAIAESIGDPVELAEINVVLGHLLHLTTEFGEAFEYCRKAIALAERLGNLHLQHLAYDLYDNLQFMNYEDPDLCIPFRRLQASLFEKLGDALSAVTCRGWLTKLLVITQQFSEAEYELQKIKEWSTYLPPDEQTTPPAIGHCFHSHRAFLLYTQGQLQEAEEELKQAIALESQSATGGGHALLGDLAFLEAICNRLRQNTAFERFCQEVSPSSRARLRFWHLSKQSLPQVGWDEEAFFAGTPLPAHWRWIDPLQKGACALGDGLEITPVVGTGFYSNVYAPRLMRQVERDVTIETVMDFSEGMTRAGGILAYQDDTTLLRFGAGILFDGELSLTVKSPTQGYFITGRGLLEAKRLTLRLERQGNLFKAWGSDGKEWYSCGQAEVEMGGKIEMGLFAECAYRYLSLARCTAAPVRFTEVRVKRGNRP